MGVQTGGLREVYGRSSNKTSRLKTPINTGVSKGNGRSNGFFGLHFIYQDPVDPDFLFWQYTFVNKIHKKTFQRDTFVSA